MAIQQEGGYDVTLVSEENSHQYNCCICQLILKEAQQVIPCGHRFCQICIRRFQETSQHSLCPSCRREIVSKFPDAAWEREIMNLKVKCQNHNKSCDWIGELRQLQGHQQNTCQYEEVNCAHDDCTVRMQRRFLDEHQQTICMYRNIQCFFCGEATLVVNLKEHHKVCEHFPLECVNKCGRKDVKREEMGQHIENECPVTIHECKYKDVGCEVKGNISTLEKHVKENTEQHLQQAVKEVCSVKNKLDLVQNTLESVQESFNEHKQKVDLTLRRIQNKLNDCPFTFVLTEFQRKLEDAKRNNTKIISNDFFCLNGYHAELWIHLNGSSSFREHVAVYIKFIKGPFDHKLEWPIKAKVEFRAKGVHCEDKKYTFFSSKADEKDIQSNFTNPSLVTKKHKGYGIHKLISHRDLHKYLKHDSMVIIVNVTEE